MFSVWPAGVARLSRAETVSHFATQSVDSKLRKASFLPHTSFICNLRYESARVWI